MPRLVFTADEIRRLWRESKSSVLVLSDSDVITAEAEDVARQLGIRLVRQAESKSPLAPASSPSQTRLPPLKVVHGGNVTLQPFARELVTPGGKVRLRDAIRSEDSAPMAAGYMQIEKGEFPWTLQYDEIDVVLEGELVIIRGPERVRAGIGDIIYIPRGSQILFSTPSFVRFVYVTYPADWDQS